LSSAVRQLAGGLAAVLRDDVALLQRVAGRVSGSTSATNFSPNSVLGSRRADTLLGMLVDLVRVERQLDARAVRRWPRPAGLADDDAADLDVGGRGELVAGAVGLQHT
jgi:hypothetical protein